MGKVLDETRGDRPLGGDWFSVTPCRRQKQAVPLATPAIDLSASIYTQNVNRAYASMQDALEVFSVWKSVYVDFSGKLQRAQIDAADL